MIVKLFCSGEEKRKRLQIIVEYDTIFLIKKSFLRIGEQICIVNLIP